MRVETMAKIGQPLPHHRYTSSLESIPEEWFENPRPAPYPPDDFFNKPLPPVPKPELKHKKSDSDELRREALMRCTHQAEERRLNLQAVSGYLTDLCRSFFEFE